MKKNRLISLLLCLCMVMTFFTGFVGSASADDGDVISYTVENGDYLFRICRKLGIDYYQCKQAIMILNGFSTEMQLNRISVGQVIKLPTSNAVASTVKGTTTTTTTVSTSTTVGTTTTTTTSTSTLTGNLAGYTVAYYLVPHTVVSGDTLNKICNSLGTSYDQYASVILGVNGLRRANSLQAGQTVLIPTTKAPTSGNCYAVVSHSVRSGENVTGICSNYGINYQGSKTLVNGLNPNTNLNKIFAGQTINIPIVTTASAAAVTTSSGAAVSVATPTVANTGFQISIDPADNGSPFAVVGAASYATRAEEGTSVVIRPNAKTGYGVKAIKVVRTDSGAPVPVTNNSFTMPASNVKVTVTYAQGLAINKKPSLNGTFDALVYGTAATSAFYGDEVVLSPLPKSGYSVKAAYYTPATQSTPKTNLDFDEATGIYSFKMPNKNIDLYVEYEQTKTCKLTYTRVGYGVVKFTVNGTTVTEVPKNTTVTVSFVGDNGWVFDSEAWEYSYGLSTHSSDTIKTLMANGIVKKIDDNTYTVFVDTTGELRIQNVIFNDFNAYTLTAGTHKYGSIKFFVTDNNGNVRTNTNWARPGETVKIITFINTSPDSRYVYKYEPIAYTYPVFDSTGDTVLYNLNAKGTVDYTTMASTGLPIASSLWVDPGLEFKMPEGNVYIVPQFSLQKATSSDTPIYAIYAVNSSHGLFTCVNSSDTLISGSKKGDTVYIKPVPETNYTVDSVRYLYDGVWSPVTYTGGGTPSEWSFAMPDGVVSVEVVYRLEFNRALLAAPSYDAGIVESMYSGEFVYMMINGLHVSPGNYAEATNVVYAQFELKAGYEIDKVKLWREYRYENTTKTETITIDPDANGQYSYTILKNDEKIQFHVTTKEIEVPKYKVIYSQVAYETTDTLGVVTVNYKDLYDLNGSNNDIEVKENEEVTMTIDTTTLASITGYKIKQVIIDGKDVYLNEETTYTFTMPARDVATQVTLEKIEVAP